MTFLVSLLVLGGLIVVHEWGHFIVAKWCGVPVPVFSVGFGPVIFHKEYNGTDYRLSLIPLGGYVMPGEPPEQQQPSGEAAAVDADGNPYAAPANDEVPAAQWRIPPEKHIPILLGGPIANFTLAFLLYCCIGRPEMFGTEIVKLFDVLHGLFTGGIAVSRLSGPVGILQAGGQVAAQGIVPLVLFAAFLSLNLAVLNLLPVPILDGGQILIALVEKAFGRPMSENARVVFALAGWALMLGLILFVTYKDIGRLFGGKPGPPAETEQTTK